MITVMIRFSALLPNKRPPSNVFLLISAPILISAPYSNILNGSRLSNKPLSNSRDKDPFDGITESDVEDAAPDSLIIDASDTEVIDVE